MPSDLPTLLLEGHDMITRTAKEHATRWGLGRADRWSLNQQEGTIRWWFGERVASAPVQVLGSWSGQTNTFVWAWDNDSILDRLCLTAELVRAYGEEHDVLALKSSPLSLGQDKVNDLIAIAFRLGGCTGLYHPYDGRTATYIVFGDVTLTEPDGSTSVVRVSAS